MQLIALVFMLGLISGCTSKFDRLLKSANRAELREDYFKAVELYEIAYKTSLPDEQLSKKSQVVDKLADIYTIQLKNPQAALAWLEIKKTLVISPEQMVATQKRIIRLALDYLSDYQKAVAESYKLLAYELPTLEKCQAVLDLATSLYQLTRLDEALQEISVCLEKNDLDQGLAYRLITIEIDLLLAQKDHSKAIKRIQDAKLRYTDLDTEQNLQLTHALILEDMEDFASAREILASLLEDSSYLDKEYLRLRMERLKVRESQQAGARLLRRKRR